MICSFLVWLAVYKIGNLATNPKGRVRKVVMRGQWWCRREQRFLWSWLAAGKKVSSVGIRAAESTVAHRMIGNGARREQTRVQERWKWWKSEEREQTLAVTTRCRNTNFGTCWQTHPQWVWHPKTWYCLYFAQMFEVVNMVVTTDHNSLSSLARFSMSEKERHRQAAWLETWQKKRSSQRICELCLETFPDSQSFFDVLIITTTLCPQCYMMLCCFWHIAVLLTSSLHLSFSHHYQESIDFNTVNIYRTAGCITNSFDVKNTARIPLKIN